MDNVKKLKMKIRESIWRTMEEKNIARFPRPVYGRIPNFVGAEDAAKRIIGLKEWRKAVVVKANPDSPQRPLRYYALSEGKKLVMATPKLRSGFLVLDPKLIPANKHMYASTIKGAFVFGRRTSLKELPLVNFVVTGSVAVDLRGNRLGKGGGYAEIEYGILRELRLVDESTPVATTVHDIQVIDYVPREEHDLTVDIISTPTRLIKVKPKPPKPKGIYWDLLGEKRELGVIKELTRIIRQRSI